MSLPKDTPNVDADRLVQPIPDSIATDEAKVALGHDLSLMVVYQAMVLFNVTLVTNQIKVVQIDLKPQQGLKVKGPINAPTVFNAAFNFVQFWDGRAADLADQAKGPPTNPVEMGSHSWDDIIARFEMDEEFKKHS